MRSVKLLVAAGAASLLSTMAFAADLPIAAPAIYAPPVEFGGWYLRGDIGFSNQRVSNEFRYRRHL
jgi:opacity protein-like surface antigen